MSLPTIRLVIGAAVVLLLSLALQAKELPTARVAPAAIEPAATAAPAPDQPTPADDFGVLVMAHGGGAEWNREVSAALAPIGKDYPIEIAFGMADAASLQDGVHRLEARGVKRVGVVRLFVSGESWYERTEQILGIRSGAPRKPTLDKHSAHGEHSGHSMAFWQLDTRAAFALSEQGLADAPEMGAVLAEQARALSRDPAREDVLIVAHGPGDDAENERWLQQIGARAAVVQRALPFRRVHVETLREDWPSKRKAAEVRIRAFVERASEEGGRAIVLPFRVQGFGPYADVLAGLNYASDTQGLVPHPHVESWVRRQAEELRHSSFSSPDQMRRHQVSSSRVAEDQDL